MNWKFQSLNANGKGDTPHVSTSSFSFFVSPTADYCPFPAELFSRPANYPIQPTPWMRLPPDGLRLRPNIFPRRSPGSNQTNQQPHP